MEQFRRIARRGLELTGKSWLGLEIGRTTPISFHGPLGYAAAASPNVRAAIDLTAKYIATRLEILEIVLEGSERNSTRLTMIDSIGWGDVGEYVAGHVVSALCFGLETISGKALTGVRITFPFSAPPWEAAYRTCLPGAALEFGGTQTTLEVSAAFAATPCITADPFAFAQASRLCDLEAARRQRHESLAERVLKHLLNRQGRYPSLVEMAGELGMSSRTLLRKLKAEGTSYQRLLDDVRQEWVLWYLRQTDLPVEEVAERVGYQDASNFSRTCRRWFGLTPLAIRGSIDRA